MNTIRITHRSLASLFPIALIAFLLSLSASNSLAIQWNGTGGDDGWETAGNWDFVIAPGPFDDVKFDSIDSDFPLGTINNVVSNSITVRSLWYANVTTGTNNYHTTLIPAGSTLGVIGETSLTSLLIGSNADSGGGMTNYTSFKGGGTLLVSNATGIMNVRQGGAGGGSSRYAKLDLSGLDTFNAVVSQLLIAGDGVGTGGSFGRLEGGIVTLAKTNVVALTSEPAMIVGGYTSANLCEGTLHLGQSNLFLTGGTMYVGTYRSTGTMKFDPANANPVAVFRGLDGVSRGGNLIIAHNRGFGANVARPSIGIVDLSGGTVDGLISSLYVGRGQNFNTAASVGIARGEFAISKGVMNVNDLNIGARRQGYAAGASGTVTVGNTAQLIVEQWIEFGLDIAVNPATNTPCFGTLNITNGGFVWVKDSLYDSGFGTNIININNGHLKVGAYLAHPASRPFDVLNMTNATLTLTLSSVNNYNNPVGAVTNLNIATTNILNVIGGGFGLGQYPLIRYYGGGIGGDGFNVIGLVGQPSRTEGFLSNNLANTSIDYVVTNVSAARWDGTQNSNWDINQTENWIDVSTATATKYLENSQPGDPVIFDDSATGTTTVSLVTNVSPVCISITNSSKTYVFNGSGKISGTTQLNKNGNGLLVITNTGANDFSGGVNINAGTLQLGLASNRLPVVAQVSVLTGTLLDLGGQYQQLVSIDGDGTSGGDIHLNGGHLNVTSGSTYGGNISGAGVFQKSAGTLTLSGSNTYSGGTILVSGTTSLINPTGSGLGTGPVVNAGTLNVGTGAAGALAASVSVTNSGTLAFNATNNSSLDGIHGPGTVTKNNTNTVTILGPSSHTGVTTITDGAFRIANGDGLGDATAATSIGTALYSRLELLGNITVPENFSISQKSSANTALGAAHFVNLSDTNTLTGFITGGSGGSYWTFRSQAGKLIVNGGFLINTTGGRTVRLEGASEGEWLTPFADNGAGIGRVQKFGPGTWTILGTQTYTGDSYAYGGRMLVNGEIQSPANFWVGDPSFDFPCLLGGTGIISSAVYVDTNGVFAPGLSIGTITLNSTLTMVAGSTNVFDVNTDTLEHDLATGMTAVTYGGTLVINPSGLGTAITNGASAQLFSATSYTGAFDAIVPPAPGPGLAWNTSQLTVSGTLGIMTVSTVPTNLTFAVTGSQLDISWPASHTGWRLQAQTNSLNVGINTNWFTVPGSTSTNQVFMPVDAANGTVFYRLIYP